MTILYYLILGLVLWAFVTGRIVPRYAKPELGERPLGFVDKLRYQLRRHEIVEDLESLRDELDQ